MYLFLFIANQINHRLSPTTLLILSSSEEDPDEVEMNYDVLLVEVDIRQYCACRGSTRSIFLGGKVNIVH